MFNWMPTLQGTTQRVPGSLFLEEITALNDKARILPYLNINNERALVILTDQQARIITDLPDEGGVPIGGSGFRKEIVDNPQFKASKGGWNFSPPQFVSKDGANLGCWYVGGANIGFMQVACRNWKYPNVDNTTAFVKQTANVDVASDTITLNFRIVYEANPGFNPDDLSRDVDSEYTATLKLGTTDGADDLYSLNITGGPGTITDLVVPITLPTAAWTGDVFIQFDLSADVFASTPYFQVDRISVLSDAVAPSADETVASPFLADELDQIQFVQSPYQNKELVLVHPNHPPQWLYFDTALPTPAYVLVAIPTVAPPSFWTTDNYPSCCSAYQGRLILGGTPIESETMVGSRPGIWEDFTVSGTDPITADNGIQFTSIYRGPTHWVNGQKDLIVGADTFEEIVQSDTGILKPDDIDVRLHSTHGSARVQPVGMGQYVAFAGENGTRVRAAKKDRDNEGWIAPDKTLLANHITLSGVKRMTRMRNPHQMLACALGNGSVAILHEDPYANISGWSEADYGGEVIDIVAQPNTSGLDILYMLIKRQVNGATKLYLEAVVDWSDESTWIHMNSYLIFDFAAPTRTITGLDHLEDSRVQVLGDGNYYGIYTVTGGQIVIDDLYPAATFFQIGLSVRNFLQLLPPVVSSEAGGLSSKKRYSEINIRVIGGTRPTVNGNPIFGSGEIGEKPAVREPPTPMGISQPLDLLRDSQVANLGWDDFQLIVVSEESPYQCEVTAVHGKLASKNL
jgi:hypothetical protein